MARKAKSKVAVAKAAVEAPAIPPALVINPFGETQQRKIKRATITDSVFTLSDKTKLFVRPVVSDIRRAVDQYNQFGQPLYFLTLGYSIVTKAPKSLQKAKPKSKSKRRSKKSRP
jgi:hypothetical protein